MPHFMLRLGDRLDAAWPAASLRTYLDAVILLAILPIVAIMVITAVVAARAEQSQVEDALARSAAALAQSVDRELTSSLDALAVLSQSELFQQGRITALGRLLQGSPRRDWDSVFLLDRDGSTVLDTSTPARPRQVTAPLRELHQRVLRDIAPAVSGVSPDGAGVAIALPVVQGGAVRYVLGVRVTEGAWQRIIASAAAPQGAYVSLFDSQQRLISSSTTTQAAPDTVYAGSAPVRLAGWRVQVALPAAPIDAGHRKALLAALATSGASLLVGLLLAAVVARRIARPLRRLATQGAGGLAQRVPVHEIALLRDALARSAEEAVAASRARDDFLITLNHELRNPLGAISAAVDVLEFSDPASETAQEAREIIARQTRHLADMIHDLLAESRSSSRLPATPAPTPTPASTPNRERLDDGALPPSRRRKVLVVQGDERLLAALRSQLELDGHTVTTAADGVEGLARLLKLRPEVCLLDIGLPDLAGFELARQARAAGYAGRMIALSSHGEHDTRQSLVAGFDACLAYPFDRQQLRTSLSGD